MHTARAHGHLHVHMALYRQYTRVHDCVDGCVRAVYTAVRPLHGPCAHMGTRPLHSRVRVHGRVTRRVRRGDRVHGPCPRPHGRVRAVYTAVYAAGYTAVTRWYTRTVHTATCLVHRRPYTAMYRPCTRPCTPMCTRVMSTAMYGRIHGRQGPCPLLWTGRVHVYTTVYTTVYGPCPRPCTGCVHVDTVHNRVRGRVQDVTRPVTGREHGRVHGPYTAVCSTRLCTRVHNRSPWKKIRRPCPPWKYQPWFENFQATSYTRLNN